MNESDIKCADPEFYPAKRSDCGTGWEILSKVGEESTYGTVYQACCSGKCSYVIKIQRFSRVQEKNDITKEISLQDDISKAGLTVKISEAWFCQTAAMIVMPALKKTVGDLLKEYSDPMVIRNIVFSCMSMLTVLHTLGWYHGDSHMNNFMVNYKQEDAGYAESETEEKRKYNEFRYKYFFIDFGLSGELESVRPLTKKLMFVRQDYISLATDINHYTEDLPDSPKKSELEKVVINLQTYINTLNR